MSVSRLMQMAAAGAGNHPAPLPIGIEDYFSTYLYTGNGSTQTITNGIDLAGEGGLVWTKERGTVSDHGLFDTERGATKYLSSNNTDVEQTSATSLTSFNSDGFSLGSGFGNDNTRTYASWTFRKAPRFFDVVTYTGNWTSGTQIAHNLGVTPGCIIVKSLSEVRNWFVYHRSLGATKHLHINTTDAEAVQTDIWNNTEPTDTHFTLGDSSDVNSGAGGGQPYVAYLFAHDPLGPSGDGSDGLIACGSYTGNGSANGPEIDLGWEPQWLLIKNASLSTENWVIFDTMRGLVVGTGDKYLRPNLSDAESAATTAISPQPTGFKLAGASGEWNGNGNTMIYIAIRRGPMRQPESGTEVFDAEIGGASVANNALVTTTGFPVDMFMHFDNYTSGGENFVVDRLRGRGVQVRTQYTNAEANYSTNNPSLDSNEGLINRSGITRNASGGVFWSFRRAPGFFDVVAYTGVGTFSTPRSHNLTVAPELVITKARTTTGQMNWYVGHYGLNQYATSISTSAVNNTNLSTFAPVTESTFVPLLDASNVSYIAYLFATLPGVSKVGSYTGNGSSQTINCGFTSGARFVLIKRTDSTGDWYVWDTARGIVTGNDPFLELNTTDAEVTSDDSIDPDATGFIVNQTATTNVNVSSASYIFYAIA